MWNGLAFILCGLIEIVAGSHLLLGQDSSFHQEKMRVPGTPMTNEQVEAGLRSIRESLRRSKDFQSNDAPTHLRLAEILAQQGDPNGAIEEYQAALRLHPTLAVAYRDMGAIYLDKHEWKQAENALIHSVELNRQDSQAHYWLGRALLAQQHFARATEAFGTAANLDDRNAEFLSDLALAYMAQGKHEEAEFALQQGISLKPDFAEVHHRLEVVKAAKQDSARLIHSTQELLEIYFRRE